MRRDRHLFLEPVYDLDAVVEPVRLVEFLSGGRILQTPGAIRPDVDFMDGILHTRDLLVLSIGRFVDSAPYTNAYDWTKVYYTSTAELDHDYLKTPDYFLRYDRGVTNVHPKSFIGRALVGKLIDSGTTLWLADKLNFLFKTDRPTVTVDVFLPFSQAPRFMAWSASSSRGRATTSRRPRCTIGSRAATWRSCTRGA